MQLFSAHWRQGKYFSSILRFKRGKATNFLSFFCYIWKDIPYDCASITSIYFDVLLVNICKPRLGPSSPCPLSPIAAWAPVRCVMIYDDYLISTRLHSGWGEARTCNFFWNVKPLDHHKRQFRNFLLTYFDWFVQFTFTFSWLLSELLINTTRTTTDTFSLCLDRGSCIFQSCEALSIAHSATFFLF